MLDRVTLHAGPEGAGVQTESTAQAPPETAREAGARPGPRVASDATPASSGFLVGGARPSEGGFRVFSNWKTWDEAREVLAGQVSPQALETLDRTWEYATACHGSQMRPNDEPYPVHLLEVVEILSQGAGIRDVDILQAALLHDVAEDTGHPVSEIRQRFGPGVAELVDWMTKPEPREGEDPAAVRRQYLEQFREAPMAAAVVKLADRLSNVQRLDTHPRPAKQRSYYQETVEQVLPHSHRHPWFEARFQEWQREFAYLAQA